MKRALTVILALVAFPLFAAPGAVGVVLVPISPGVVAGANGAQWTTTLWAHNADIGEVTIFGDPGSVVAPNVTKQLGVPYANLSHPGYFLMTAQTFGGVFSIPGDLWLTLRTLDSASAFHTAGTELPLPGFGDFFAGTIVFPNVPANGHSRLKLRIYSMENSVVTVRTYDGTQLIATKTAGLIGRSTDGDLTGGFGIGAVPRIPAYAELDLAPGLVSDQLRVSIDAPESTWAFVSITDDATHEFTVVQPHLPSAFITGF